MLSTPAPAAVSGPDAQPTTTTGFPSAGSYVGPVTTNTAVTTTANAPAVGTYVGAVITNSTPTTSLT